ncbi:MAG: hypothetical protein P9M07_02100 [Candidatus Aceula meridiana]|nr:hypothetical protein [Candidatus Aceula meridiana]
MIKRNKKKKGQNVAEYAILIALVVGAIIAMQKFAQRGLQGRVRDATEWMVAQGNDQIGHSTGQYEPYYSESSYDVYRDSSDTKTLCGEVNFKVDADTDVTRNGYQRTIYDDTQNVDGGMNF